MGTQTVSGKRKHWPPFETKDLYPENIPRRHRVSSCCVFMTGSQSACEDPEEMIIPWPFKLSISIQLKTMETKEKWSEVTYTVVRNVFVLSRKWTIAHVVLCAFTKYRQRHKKRNTMHVRWRGTWWQWTVLWNVLSELRFSIFGFMYNPRGINSTD